MTEFFDEEYLKGMLADIDLRREQTGMPFKLALQQVAFEERLSGKETLVLQLEYERHVMGEH